jgi:DNA-binding transcriptional LysR family regulator
MESRSGLNLSEAAMPRKGPSLRPDDTVGNPAGRRIQLRALEPRFDLLSVRFALTLAEELHFGRAAARHFMTPQAFGRRIQRLEHALGYSLFERTSRVVTVTPRGERVLVAAERALDNLDSLADPRRNRRSTDHVPLIIGVLGFGLGARWRDFVGFYQQCAPTMPLQYAELNLADQYEKLLSHSVDAAIVQHTDELDEIRFSVTFSMKRVLVVPARSAFANATVLAPTDVEACDWLRVDLPTVQRLRENLPGRLVGATVRSPAAIPTAVAMTGAMSHHGMGAATYYRRPDVRYIRYQEQPMLIGIATRDDDRRPEIEALRRAAALMSSVDLELDDIPD